MCTGANMLYNSKLHAMGLWHRNILAILGNGKQIFKGHVKSVNVNKRFVYIHFELSAISCKIWLDIYDTEFLTLFWFAMLVNEYRLKIQFKKVRNVRNINNIPMVDSRPLWNVGLCKTYAQGLIWSLIGWPIYFLYALNFHFAFNESEKQLQKIIYSNAKLQCWHDNFTHQA
jgi:hypothetical protein